MKSGEESVVRVRIAPSPTGDPHVGTAYIALFNYAFAKKNNGKFVLRIEDTDQARSRKESETMIMESLKWLNIQWDEGPDIGGSHGPYRQSERSEIYREHARILLENGSAYRCFCTKERLEKMREEQKKSKQFSGYDGFCRNLPKETIDQYLSENRPYVIRIKLPQQDTISFRDELRGQVEFDCSTLNDQILMKADGYPTYHLANVVDDHLMKISHVIRAEEWISSTPIHILLYKAYGWQPAKFIHMPLLRNADKSKISKRKNPVSLRYYERQGFLPEALINFLALQGWSLPTGEEIFSIDEMIKHFTLDRISLGGPVFDLTKLIRFNGIYMRNLSADDLAKRITEAVIKQKLAQLQDQGYLMTILPLIKDRLRLLSEFDARTHFLYSGALTYSARDLILKGKNLNQTKNMLNKALEMYDAIADWKPGNLDSETRQFSEIVKWATKDLFMVLRIIVTGSTESPPLFESMTVLGKTECLNRLQDAIATLQLE
ncbi:glutamate--tRNA ligase [candidate division KSB1 bacterium]|nr:glutamate--tRNA ligase [candidate division KSB1 bacterium]